MNIEVGDNHVEKISTTAAADPEFFGLYSLAERTQSSTGGPFRTLWRPAVALCAEDSRHNPLREVVGQARVVPSARSLRQSFGRFQKRIARSASGVLQRNCQREPRPQVERLLRRPGEAVRCNNDIRVERKEAPELELGQWEQRQKGQQPERFPRMCSITLKRHRTVKGHRLSKAGFGG